ncbi:MAG: universal stress protein [Chitinispirillaceae bacterium]
MDQQSQMQFASGEEKTTGLKVIYPVYRADNTLVPFVHALKLAQVTQGEFEIVDVRSEEEALEHLGVRGVLEKWGVLPSGSHRSDLSQIGLKVKKVVKNGNKRREILRRLDKRPHDLMVLGVENHSSLSRIFSSDLSRSLCDHFPAATIFVPDNGRSFVDEETGRLNLNTILLPLADSSSYDFTMRYLDRFLTLLPGVKPTVIGLHSGTGFPKIKRPSPEKVHWLETVRSESVVDAIAHAAEIYNADLILMCTKGRYSLARKLAGTLTEKTVRSSPCPLLSIPYSD